jgi:hypothetical protein
VIFLLSCAALTQDEIGKFVARLFDKDQLTVWPSSVPLPYCSKKKNPPPEVRTITFFDFYPIQNVYPGHQVDIELLDGDHNGWKEPAGNDTEYEGVTSVE